jgi:hypothetical protein
MFKLQKKLMGAFVGASVLLLSFTFTLEGDVLASSSILKERVNVSRPNKISLLFLQQAQTATLTDQQKNCYQLALSGISDSTLYFSDQPSRIVGHVTPKDFLAIWQANKVKPNAAIHGHYMLNNKMATYDLVVELTAPHYNAKSQIWQYQACLTDVKLEASTVPAKLSMVTLFIDNFDGDGI